MMINLEAVYKSYGTVSVLEDITLGIEQGKRLCIVGPSGCGKSTLLKIMALMTSPDEGLVTVDGAELAEDDYTRMDNLRSSTISYSFQEPLLLPYLSALENIVDLLLPLSKKENGSRNDLERDAKVMLSKLGLADRAEHFPSKLSVGEKKRVDLARALLKDSKLLIADEPFSNLDPDTVGLVTDLFDAYIRTGGTVVYSTVNPSDSTHADTSYSMRRRQVMQDK